MDSFLGISMFPEMLEIMIPLSFCLIFLNSKREEKSRHSESIEDFRKAQWRCYRIVAEVSFELFS